MPHRSLSQLTRTATAASMLSLAALGPIYDEGPLEWLSRPLSSPARAAEATAAARLDPAVDVQPDIFAFMIDDHAYLPDQRVLERLAE